MRMTQKLHRASILVFALVLLSTVLIGGTAPQKVAAVPYSADSVKERSIAWLYGRAIGQCFKVSDLRNGAPSQDVIESENATNGKWFFDSSIDIGGVTPGAGEEETINVGVLIAGEVEGNVDDGLADCHNPDLVKNGLAALGIDGKTALCEMGFTREKAGSDISNTCASGSGHYKSPVDTESDAIQNLWNDYWREVYLEGKTITSALTDDMKYYIAWQTFVEGCRANLQGAYTNQDLKGNKKFKTPYYDEDKEKVIQAYYITEDDGNDTQDVGGNGLFYDDSKAKCTTLEKDLDKWIDAYAATIKKPASQGGGSSGASGSAQPTCESESGDLGWFLCGALRIIDGAINGLDKAVNELLFINRDVYGDKGLDAAWGVMRNIALLLLVPLMIFMVIGTAIGFGPFDPYTVKKALPRMMVAVLFIVLSLPITRFGVELSNVVGQGVGNLIVSASPSKITSLQDIFAQNGLTSGDSLFTGAVVAGAGAAALFGGLTIGILLSFALVTVVALLMGFVVLVMRQVLIVMLIVVAPLAILVWIFPGNDKLWAIWKTSFIAMLLLYPIIAVLIASGKFVAGIASF